MEMLAVVLHDLLTGNVPFAALAALLGLFALSVALFVTRGALAARRWKKTFNRHNGDNTPDYGADWDWDRIDDFSYDQDV